MKFFFKSQFSEQKSTVQKKKQKFKALSSTDFRYLIADFNNECHIILFSKLRKLLNFARHCSEFFSKLKLVKYML